MKGKYKGKKLAKYIEKISSSKKYFKFLKPKPIKKKLYSNYLIKSIFLLLFFFVYFIFRKIGDKIKKYINKDDYLIEKQLSNNYVNNSFIIISYVCESCGLFSHYNRLLSCTASIVKDGRIPIANFIRFKNIFNRFNESSLTLDQNPWEYFFKQPFGYTLKDVKKYAKHRRNYECTAYPRPSQDIIFYNKFYKYYWNNIYKTYFPIKDEIIQEAEKVMKKLFKKSENVLGIFVRGTDFLALRPRNHAIQPEPEVVMNDVDKFDQENHYDYYFLSTEDDIIRNKFINRYKDKLKYFKANHSFRYNNTKVLAYNEDVNGNLEFMKVYLINTVIVSKCIDIICGRTNGSVFIFIITKGFRNIKVYNYGKYT